MKKILATALLVSGLTSESAYASTSAKADVYHTPKSEIACIAKNIYWEARNQTAKGMIGVALVSRNRVRDNRFPHSYCEVIQQGPTRPSWKDQNVEIPLRNRCQFSWYCDGLSDNIPTADADVYQFAISIAFKIYHGELTDFTSGATHYHASYVKPEWRKTKTKTIQIQDHIFYRWEQGDKRDF